MDRTYKGKHIYECERVTGEHEGKWIVQTYHDSGTPYADELCPHYRTLAEARADIDEMVTYEASLRAEARRYAR